MKRIKYYSVLLFFFILIIIYVTPAFAQGSPAWSSQQRIPGYENNTWPPILIADQNRTVHAFSYQWLNKSEGNAVRAIVYNRLVWGQGWTLPVDIILSPLKNDARLLDAFLDQNSIVHIIFWGGDNTGANIYYSNAPVAEAGKANIWLSPILVAENAQDPENGAFYAEDQNNLVILFADKSTGNGLFSTSSIDGGVTWSKPILVSYTHNSDNLISGLKIFKSTTGWIHAIWNEITRGGQGRGIYYSRKKIDDIKWSDPVKLAEAESGYGTNTPTIIEYHGAVLAFYNLGGIIWQRSYDGEKDWTPPIQLFTRHVGVNGSLSLVVDGNDELHIFFGQRITGSPDIHGMWHSIFSGTGWSEPEAVVSGPAVSDHIGDKAFDPFEARAVVSQGNVLLVTWRSDPGLKGNGVWYSETVLDSPELPLVTPRTILPTKQVNHYPTESPLNLVPTPRPGSETAMDALDSLTNSSESNNPTNALFIAIVPVLLLISMVIILSFRTHHKRN